MLRSALASWAGSPAAATEILTAAGVDPTARGETLDVTAFVRIATAGASARAARPQAGDQQQHGHQAGDGDRE
jgi:16S rRNA (adenine1518-N6/adenine1519-N6)-dimethyltransferase